MQWKLLWPRDQETEFPVEAWWLSQTQECQTEQIHPQTFDDPFFYSTGMIYMHYRKRPTLFKSGQLYLHQDITPVHDSILVTDYLTNMGIKTVCHPPYCPDLPPCDFWLFLKLRGCCYETIEEMKEAVTNVIDTLRREDFHEVFEKLS